MGERFPFLQGENILARNKEGEGVEEFYLFLRTH